jgi:hypothetical protein
MNTNSFSIFFKSGGGDTISIVNKYWQKITKIFDKMSEYSYSTDIDKFHIEMRVDGDFLTFGDSEGCNNLRLFKKKRLIANSISFGKNIYINENILSEFLIKNLLLAFEQMIIRLKKEKLNIDEESLLTDLNKHISDSW